MLTLLVIPITGICLTTQSSFTQVLATLNIVAQGESNSHGAIIPSPTVMPYVYLTSVNVHLIKTPR